MFRFFFSKCFQSSVILKILMIASEKTQHNLSDSNHFLLKKRFDVKEKQIFPSEKLRNSGNYNYDYAHSFFGKGFQSSALYSCILYYCVAGFITLPYFRLVKLQ